MELEKLSARARLAFLDASIVLYQEPGTSFNDALGHAQTMPGVTIEIQEEVMHTLSLVRSRLFPTCDFTQPLSRDAGRAIIEFVKQESPPLKPDSHKYDLP